MSVRLAHVFFLPRTKAKKRETVARDVEKKKANLCTLFPHLDQSKSPTCAPHILSYKAARLLLPPSAAEGDFPSPGDLNMLRRNHKNLQAFVSCFTPPLFLNQRVWLACVWVCMCECVNGLAGARRARVRICRRFPLMGPQRSSSSVHSWRSIGLRYHGNRSAAPCLSVSHWK